MLLSRLLFLTVISLALATGTASLAHAQVKTGIVDIIEGTYSTACPSRDRDDVLGILQTDPPLSKELQRMWEQSEPTSTPEVYEGGRDHEEGGWILQCRSGTEGNYTYNTEIHRVTSGTQTSLNLLKGEFDLDPSDTKSCRVAATIHTHPGPGDKNDPPGWGNSYASLEDWNGTNTRRVPGIFGHGKKGEPPEWETYGGNSRPLTRPLEGEIYITEYTDEGDPTGKKFRFKQLYETELNNSTYTNFGECPPPKLRKQSLKSIGQCSAGQKTEPARVYLNNTTGKNENYLITPTPEAAYPVEGSPLEGTIEGGGNKTIYLQGACPGPACKCNKTLTAKSSVTYSVGKTEETTSLTTACRLKCPETGGDPHLERSDGLRFDIHARGEFVLVRSLSGDYEIQTRQAPYPTSRAVAINTAVAVKLGPSVVMIEPGGNALLNGEVLDIDVGASVNLEDGGTVSRGETRWTVLGQNGNGAEIDDRTLYLDIHARLTEDGKYVGLLGNTAVKGVLLGRDGESYPTPVSPEKFYGGFVESWRISGTTSLFTYEDGKSTDDYTDRDLPESIARISGLPQDARQEAWRTCQAAGVTDPFNMRDCILDVATMGADAHPEIFSSKDASTLFLVSPDLGEPETPTLKHPDEAEAGTLTNVEWDTTPRLADLIVIAAKTAKPQSRESYALAEMGSPVNLRAPNGAGTYEVRYINGTGDVLARSEIAVTEGEITLSSPDRVDAGEPFAFSYEGEYKTGDYVRAHGPAGKYNYTYAKRETETSELTIKAPEIPGEFELRYYRKGAQQPIGVRTMYANVTQANFNTPAEAPAGSMLEVDWTGPDYPGDFIAVASPDSSDKKWIHYLGVNNPAQKLRLPDDAGSYEIRYITARERRILARKTIKILPTSATLDVPSEAAAGSRVDIDWTGPNNPGDFISISLPGAKDGVWIHYLGADKRARVLSLPDEPGTYEIRYVTSHKKNILARQRIKVVKDKP